MFYKKNNMPEQGEIVICTVKTVLKTSVFATLDEYKNKEGMIHISEVSPGRIRNIRDFVKEGKKIVCKVLRTNERGHIDLSLRRVNTSQRINKSNDMKQQQKSEKLLDQVGKQLNIPLEEMFKLIGSKLIEEYGSLYNAFQQFTKDPDLIKKYKLEKKTEETLSKIIQEKVKLPEVTIESILLIQNNSPDGIEIIKNLLIKIQKGTIKITYIAAPRYKISITASDYKTAESLLKNIEETVTKESQKDKSIASFQRI